MSTINVTHLFTAFNSLGGVESLLHYHYQQDARWGMNSQFVIYFENQSQPKERVHYLGFNPRTTIREARRRLSQAIGKIPPDVAVYHNSWGMPYLIDLDHAHRRILVQHGQVPGMEESFRLRQHWLDGVICFGETLRPQVNQYCPRLGSDRVTVLPYPINPPAVTSSRAPWGARPLRLGFCGRLTTDQKRIERIPPLCAQLDRAGLHYQLEFLGDGRDRAWLESQLPDRTRFIFHGRQQGKDYWRILSQWDCLLFTSDYEGVPLSLLEGLSAGVIPLYPAIGSGADAYIRQIDPEFLYPPGELEPAAAALSKLSRAKEDQIEALRTRCRELAAPHFGDAYMDQYTAFLQQIQQRPKLSGETVPHRPFPVDLCSFTWLERIGALRRAFLRLTRKG
jgi:glycosyltransferase involved in cell wall biosynthesis